MTTDKCPTLYTLRDHSAFYTDRFIFFPSRASMPGMLACSFDTKVI